MKYRIETWSIRRLIEAYKTGMLNLNPPYQRRFIWTLSDQQTLIDSIMRGYAIPNLFLLEKENGSFEMVDGQQRTRTILGFINNQIPKIEDSYYNKDRINSFLSFELPITIIELLEPTESIEEFYALVNKSGINLNRPELKKAEFYDTMFLELIQELTGNIKFQKLELFTDTTIRRMNDIDFVSELVTVIKEGRTDKKIRVDRLFENDITDEQYTTLKQQFEKLLDLFEILNLTYPIKKTRYRQRNDFYTLFDFFNQIIDHNIDFLQLIYKLLVHFSPSINPSNDKCEPFQEYAFHCISQSNSKSARDKRFEILEAIFLNKKKSPNKTQKQVMKFYNIEELKEQYNYLLFDLSKFK